MNPTPAISVVTVCRNALPALRRTVESVLAQRYPALEYWVVDGASTDGTPEFLRALEARGVRHVSERDQGISDAMNKGVRLAGGQWIAHLHAGDEYLPGALEAVALAVARDPDAEVVCGFMLKREPAGDVIYGCDPSCLAQDMTVNHPASFVRRAVFERLGGFESGYPNAMDYDFFLKLHRAGVRFTVVPQALAAMDSGGISERSLWNTLRESQRIRGRRLDSGIERSTAWVLFLYGRGATRRLLQRAGLGALVGWYRRRFALLRKG